MKIKKKKKKKVNFGLKEKRTALTWWNFYFAEDNYLLKLSVLDTTVVVLISFPPKNFQTMIIIVDSVWGMSHPLLEIGQTNSCAVSALRVKALARFIKSTPEVVPEALDIHEDMSDHLCDLLRRWLACLGLLKNVEENFHWKNTIFIFSFYTAVSKSYRK